MHSAGPLTLTRASPTTSNGLFGKWYKKAVNLYAHLLPRNCGPSPQDYWDVEKGYSPKSVYIDIKNEMSIFKNNDR